MFKKKRGIKLPYNKQGLIYFTCMNFKDAPEDVQKKILNLCTEVGKEDYKALFELITKPYKTMLSVSLEYNLSEKRLWVMQKKFYETWDKVV